MYSYMNIAPKRTPATLGGTLILIDSRLGGFFIRGSMPEPSTPAILGKAIVAVSAPAAAVFIIWPFGIAFVFGVVALIYMAKMQNNLAIVSILGSTLLGGALSQLLAEPSLLMIRSFLPSLTVWAEKAQSHYAMIAILAILIGLFAQTVMPKLLVRAGKQVDGGQ